MEEFYQLRVDLYQKRKEYILSKLESELETLKNKARFISGVVKGDIKIITVKKIIIA